MLPFWASVNVLSELDSFDLDSFLLLFDFFVFKFWLFLVCATIFTFLVISSAKTFVVVKEKFEITAAKVIIAIYLFNIPYS